MLTEGKQRTSHPGRRHRPGCAAPQMCVGGRAAGADAVVAVRGCSSRIRGH